MENKYKYIIVDDNDTDRLLLSLFLKEYPFLENKATFSSPEDGLIFFENNTIDLLFLDIEMDNINGLEFQEYIREKAACTVFTTSHPEYALNGFELNAYDYLIKPITKERIDTCIKKLKNFLDMRQKASLYDNGAKKEQIVLKSGISYVNIIPQDILYLEALKDYTKIVLINKKAVTIHGNIGSTLKNETFAQYIRIHKSFAIERSKIEQIRKNEVLLSTGIILPLSSSYKKALLEKIGNPVDVSDFIQ